jgi:hypothetical protein
MTGLFADGVTTLMGTGSSGAGFFYAAICLKSAIIPAEIATLGQRSLRFTSGLRSITLKYCDSENHGIVASDFVSATGLSLANLSQI